MKFVRFYMENTFIVYMQLERRSSLPYSKTEIELRNVKILKL